MHPRATPAGRRRIGSDAVTDHDDLLAMIRSQAVVPGDVILSSGQRASWYVDLRRILLAGRARSCWPAGRHRWRAGSCSRRPPT